MGKLNSLKILTCALVLVYALSFLSAYGYTNKIPKQATVNYTTVGVNDSDYWDDLDTPHDFTDATFSGDVGIGGTPTNSLSITLEEDVSNFGEGFELTKGIGSFKLTNGVSTADRFLPSFVGVGDGLRIGLAFDGTEGGNINAQDGAILYRVRRQGGAGGIDDDHVAYSFQNYVTQLVNIFGDGSVRIGETANTLPPTKLYVEGNATFEDDVYVNKSIIVEEDSTFQKDISIIDGNLGIGVPAKSTTSVWLERNNPTFVMRDAGVGQTKFGDYGGVFTFEVDEDAENVANARMSITISGVPELRLNKDGLGLSTTTPRAELDVNGSAIID